MLSPSRRASHRLISADPGCKLHPSSQFLPSQSFPNQRHSCRTGDTTYTELQTHLLDVALVSFPWGTLQGTLPRRNHAGTADVVVKRSLAARPMLPAPHSGRSAFQARAKSDGRMEQGHHCLQRVTVIIIIMCKKIVEK